MIGIELIAACAPNVAPPTIQQIVKVENAAADPLAINVNPKRVVVRGEDGKPVLDANGKPKVRLVKFVMPMEVKTVQDAVTVSYAAIDAGHSVDMGYMQVNSMNLKWLGYTVEDMFVPCKNVAAGARVLTAFYSRALKEYAPGQPALRAALSAYNTGDFEKGFFNGYLARYGIGSASADALPPVPAINPFTAGTAVFSRSTQQSQPKEAPMQANNTDTTTTRAAPVVSRSPDDGSTPGVQIEHTPDQAEAFGAFEETAISEGDAWEANADIADDNATAVVVGGRNVRQSVSLTSTTPTNVPAASGDGE